MVSTSAPVYVQMSSVQLRAAADGGRPSWQLPEAAPQSDAAQQDSETSGGSAHLNGRLFGMEVQRRAAGLHPVQPQVLHLLSTPALLLLTLLQTLLGHGFVLHNGCSCSRRHNCIVTGLNDEFGMCVCVRVCALSLRSARQDSVAACSLALLGNVRQALSTTLWTPLRTRML